MLWFFLRPLVTLPANLIACGTHACCLVIIVAKQLLAFDSPVFWRKVGGTGCYGFRMSTILLLHPEILFLLLALALMYVCTADLQVFVTSCEPSSCTVKCVMACVIAFSFNRSWALTAHCLTAVTVSFCSLTALCMTVSCEA